MNVTLVKIQMKIVAEKKKSRGISPPITIKTYSVVVAGFGTESVL
jgi:hypothetical protein